MEGKLNDEQKKILLQIAKQSVESFVRDGVVPKLEIKDVRLNQPEGAFVTLHHKGVLRGCIGMILIDGDPLWKTIRDMAIAAATEDNRFKPVSIDELGELDYEISVLSTPAKISDWRQIELGKHGVIVRKGRQSGVFLPQVATETGWDLETFLGQLCTQKAGLDWDAYKNDPGVSLEVFEAEVIHE